MRAAFKKAALKIAKICNPKLAGFLNPKPIKGTLQFLAELQARMSRASRIMLFSHRNYQVSLMEDCSLIYIHCQLIDQVLTLPGFRLTTVGV